MGDLITFSFSIPAVEAAWITLFFCAAIVIIIGILKG